MCRIGKSQIKVITLINTSATSRNFINAVNAQQIYKIKNISLVELLKLRPISSFNSTTTPPITYTIYLYLQVNNYVEDLCPLFITRLGTHSLILGKA
jgi:hypothetical protein